MNQSTGLDLTAEEGEPPLMRLATIIPASYWINIIGSL